MEALENKVARDEIDLPVGTRVGRYFVTQRLAAGAMGVVYEGFDPELERRVALKVLRPELMLRRKSVRERLLREAQALARVDHANVVRVFDVGPIEDSVFVAMEFVAGCSGREWLREGPTWQRVLDVFADAARGLSAIHGAGLVHRDFKPSNIVIGRDGRVRVLDLGLARAVGARSEVVTTAHNTSDVDNVTVEMARAPIPSIPPAASSSLLEIPLTMTGAAVGTPPYMAPEQHTGDPSDARADQFAFCVSLYEALVGQRPFQGRTPNELGTAKRRGVVPPPPRGLGVPPAVFDVLRRGMRRDPARRFVSMHALVVALGHARHRRRTWWAVGAAATAVCLGGAAFFVGGGWTTQGQCDPSTSRLPSVWNDARRDGLQARFEATRLPYAMDAWAGTRARVDAFSDAWSGAWVQACERSASADTPAATDHTSTCLAQRLDELDARLTVLQRGRETTIEHAVLAVARLSAPAECLDLRPYSGPLPPPPPEQRVGVDAIRHTLDESKALEDAGDYASAVARADVAVAAAAASKYRPVLAEALHRRGRALDTAGREAEAVDPLREAAILATAEGYDALAAEAAIDLGGLLTATHREEASRWLRSAEASVRRLGEPADLRRAWLNNVALMELAEDRPAAAYDTLSVALELTRALHGAQHPAVARVLDNLSIAAHRMGKLEHARALSHEALEIMENELGPQHPQIGRALLNAGTLAIAAADYERAIEQYTRALSIHRTAFGEDNREVAYALDGLGFALSGLGRHEEALTHQRRGLSVLTQTAGPDDPSCGTSHLSIGRSLSGLSRHEEALVEYRRAHEIFRNSLGEQHSATAAALNDIGIALHLLERLDEAREYYAQALAIHEASLSASPPELAKTLGNLAMLSEAAGDFAQAKRELERAIALLDTGDGADPYALARLRASLGGVELELGHAARALTSLQQAVAALRGLPGAREDLAEAEIALDRARLAAIDESPAEPR